MNTGNYQVDLLPCRLREKVMHFTLSIGGSSMKEPRIPYYLLCIHPCPSSLWVFMIFYSSFAGRTQRFRILAALAENRFNSQHLHGGSQLSITLGSGDLIHSCDLWGHWACTECTYMHADKAIIFINITFGKWLYMMIHFFFYLNHPHDFYTDLI